MGRKCCKAKNCPVSSTTHPDEMLHCFPAFDRRRFKLWCDVAEYEDDGLHVSLFLCHRHFRAEDYLDGGRRRKIRHGANPVYRTGSLIPIIDEKPHACDSCKFIAADQRSLKKHMAVHKGVKSRPKIIEEPNEELIIGYPMNDLSPSSTFLTSQSKREMANDADNIHGVVSDPLTKEESYHELIVELPINDLNASLSSSTSQVNKGEIMNGSDKMPGKKVCAVNTINSCDWCDYTTPEGRDMKRHVRIHTGEKRYSCNMCDYKCATQSLMKRHMFHHTGEKPFACAICDYKAAQAGAIKTHMRSHTGERPYACDSCDYRAAQRGRLKMHMKTHSGEKPYACDKCDYKGGNLYHLKRHKQTHTGGKPHACDSCKFIAADQRSLKKHLAIHKGTL